MLPKNATQSVQQVAENIRNFSIRFDKIFAQRLCVQVSVIAILILQRQRRAGAQAARLAVRPPGVFRQKGPQRDHDEITVLRVISAANT
jgi:hypothetical protein